MFILMLHHPDLFQVTRGMPGISKRQEKKMGFSPFAPAKTGNFPLCTCRSRGNSFSSHSILANPLRINLVGSVGVFVEVRPGSGSGDRGQAEVTGTGSPGQANSHLFPAVLSQPLIIKGVFCFPIPRDPKALWAGDASKGHIHGGWNARQGLEREERHGQGQRGEFPWV